MSIYEKLESRDAVDHGLAITLACEIYDINLAEVGKKLGLHRQQIHQMKQSKRVGIDKVRAIADAAGLTVKELEGLTDMPITHYLIRERNRLTAHLSKRTKNDKRVRKIEELMDEVIQTVVSIEHE